MRELTDDEADAIMASIPPSHRQWCDAGCGPRPGLDAKTLEGIAQGCGCRGCIYGRLGWDDFVAWQEREKERGLGA